MNSAIFLVLLLCLSEIALSNCETKKRDVRKVEEGKEGDVNEDQYLNDEKKVVNIDINNEGGGLKIFLPTGEIYVPSERKNVHIKTIDVFEEKTPIGQSDSDNDKYEDDSYEDEDSDEDVIKSRGKKPSFAAPPNDSPQIIQYIPNYHYQLHPNFNPYFPQYPYLQGDLINSQAYQRPYSNQNNLYPSISPGNQKLGYFQNYQAPNLEHQINNPYTFINSYNQKPSYSSMNLYNQHPSYSYNQRPYSFINSYDQKNSYSPINSYNQKPFYSSMNSYNQKPPHFPINPYDQIPSYSSMNTYNQKPSYSSINSYNQKPSHSFMNSYNQKPSYSSINPDHQKPYSSMNSYKPSYSSINSNNPKPSYSTISSYDEQSSYSSLNSNNQKPSYFQNYESSNLKYQQNNPYSSMELNNQKYGFFQNDQQQKLENQYNPYYFMNQNNQNPQDKLDQPTNNLDKQKFASFENLKQQFFYGNMNPTNNEKINKPPVGSSSNTQNADDNSNQDIYKNIQNYLNGNQDLTKYLGGLIEEQNYGNHENSQAFANHKAGVGKNGNYFPKEDGFPQISGSEENPRNEMLKVRLQMVLKNICMMVANYFGVVLPPAVYQMINSLTKNLIP